MAGNPRKRKLDEPEYYDSFVTKKNKDASSIHPSNNVETPIGLPFMKDPSANFSISVPYYCPYPSNVLLQVVDFITGPPKEASILTIFDSPGVGKTTTIHVAVKEAEAFYVRITPNCSVLSQYSHHFNRPIPPTGLKEQEFILQMEKLVMSTFAAVWKSIMKAEGALDANEFELEDATAVEESTCQALLHNLLERMNNKVMVLHLDDLQYLCDIPADWKSCNNRRNLEQKDLPNYKLICLTAGWAKIWNERMRLVLTGTNINLSNGVKVGNEVKIQSVQIGNFTAEMVAKTIEQFFRVKEAKVNYKEIANKLKGPPRMTQFFLHYLKDSASAEVLTNDSTAIQTHLDNAYQKASTSYFEYSKRTVIDKFASKLPGGTQASEGLEFPRRDEKRLKIFWDDGSNANKPKYIGSIICSISSTFAEVRKLIVKDLELTTNFVFVDDLGATISALQEQRSNYTLPIFGVTDQIWIKEGNNA